MLPPEGVQKIKFVNKKDIKTYVSLDQALKSWGGQDDYVFSFVPESVPEEKPVTAPNNNKKVFLNSHILKKNYNIKHLKTSFTNS